MKIIWPDGSRMGKFRIVIASKRVEKELDQLPLAIFDRVVEAIQRLADNPRHSGVRKLKHSKIGGYRVRVGDYRIIYDIDDERREVLILRVMHRKETYRK